MKTIVLSTLAVFALSVSVNADSNQVMKRCLDDNGYTPEKFQTYNFSAAASCHSEYRSGMRKVQLQETRQFLKDHPWYKGRNWQWEDCAKDNRCTRRFSWWSTQED